MAISQHADTFAGRPVELFDPAGNKPSRMASVYRLQLGHDAGHSFPELLDLFLAAHRGDDLTALVVGAWDYETMLESAAEVVEALASALDRMPNLKSLFFGDITYKSAKSRGFSAATCPPCCRRSRSWKNSASAGRTT